ncbi:fungal specific transcription factor [Paramyrothecium foliicola]|nr:fungal specific transcription factor [Paramyrothecium foliicola]
MTSIQQGRSRGDAGFESANNAGIGLKWRLPIRTLVVLLTIKGTPLAVSGHSAADNSDACPPHFRGLQLHDRKIRNAVDLMDVSETTNAFEEGSTEGPDIPSCQGCRRRKLKCSREQPNCSHCRRLESPCIYDHKKHKPGLKLGAVGSLSRRVEVLEDAILNRPQEQGTCNHQQYEASNQGPTASHNVMDILSMLAGELHKLNNGTNSAVVGGTEILNGHAVASPTVSPTSSRHTVERPRKRRRVDSCGNPNVDLSGTLEQDLNDIKTSLPPAALLEDIINTYFDITQPWIPVLHETRFRKRIQENDELPQLVVVLHAMVVAALRFVNNEDHGLSPQGIKQQMQRSRNFVKLAAMESLSVENLQSLIILAFTDIGNGEASKAWSIIGSLTRTVEYLQLSVETDHKNLEPLLKPFPTMLPPTDWTVEEERRRVFWTIFCLDRYCSVTTGWNTSLTSDDVQRRLPADGGLWHKEEAVTTPFFGIWDKSGAKLENSIAFLPGHYPSPEQTTDQANTVPVTSRGRNSNAVDMSTVGAFAYCIEATESLSRITTYFLQQKVNFEDRQQVGSWLTRFKELDLRLVHWKMFLPQRWKDSNISRQPDLVNMDPNLTLAHVTHNASMILLHQSIAYPKPRWSRTFKLPSSCSADTCQGAAIETTTITQKYLKHTPRHGPVASQYAFCVYISARVLLVQWQYYKTELAAEFWILVESLDEMGQRWLGSLLDSAGVQCLAAKYACELRELHEKCVANPHFEIDILGYTSGMLQASAQTPSSPNKHSTPRNHLHQRESSVEVQQQQWSHGLGGQLDPHSPSIVTQVSPRAQVDLVANEPGQTIMQTSAFNMNEALPSDRLSAISHTLMDEHFTAMDRIISLDDMIFNAQTGSGTPFAWMSGNGGSVE